MEKSFQELDLSNVFLFAAALEDPETCRLVLEIILGESVPPINVHAEHSVLISSDFRSVRLDIYAKDELEVNYNVEAQNRNEGNLSKRSRYHQAEMDVTSFKPGLVHFWEYMENSTDAYVAEVEEETINKLHDRVVKLKKERELEARYMTFEELLKSREKEGRAGAILEILEESDIVSEALKEKILAERDIEVLKKWNKLAAKVTTIEEFTEKM